MQTNNIHAQIENLHKGSFGALTASVKLVIFLLCLKRPTKNPTGNGFTLRMKSLTMFTTQVYLSSTKSGTHTHNSRFLTKENRKKCKVFGLSVNHLHRPKRKYMYK